MHKPPSAKNGWAAFMRLGVQTRMKNALSKSFCEVVEEWTG